MTQFTLEQYEQIVTDLSADSVIVRMAMSMPAGFPIDNLFMDGPEGPSVHAEAAQTFNFLYDLGMMQERREPVLPRPSGAVADAIRRVAKEIGLAQT